MKVLRLWPFRKSMLDKVEHLQAVTVHDDDILVVTAKQTLTVNQKKELEAGIRAMDLVNKLMILDEGLSLSVIRRQI